VCQALPAVIARIIRRLNAHHCIMRLTLFCPIRCCWCLQWVREGKAFLLVYSVISKESLQDIAAFRDRILMVKDDNIPPMYVVSVISLRLFTNALLLLSFHDWICEPILVPLQISHLHALSSVHLQGPGRQQVGPAIATPGLCR